MSVNPNIAKIASMVSDTSRAAMLTVLLDGRFHPASELAYMAGIQPQTASFHLAKLVSAGIVSVTKQGRHRYYGIEDSDVAQVLESLLSIAPPVEVRSLRQSYEQKEIRKARTCYDHLAGNLGVKLTESLLQMDFLHEGESEFDITEKGREFFASFEIDLEKVKKKRRSFAHKCLDWSERRYHLAGALGNALLERLFELRWIERLPKTRAIKITSEGKKGFQEIFRMELG